MPALVNKNKCTGCTACLCSCPLGAIVMKKDEFGFSYPAVDTDVCVECGRCTDVCPVMGSITAAAPIGCYAAYSLESEIRNNSSSGGVFSALCAKVFADGGVVYGAAYDRDYQVVHLRVDKISELNRLRGAKYAQSDIVGVYDQIKSDLESGIKVLFSGTPCQVAGLSSCVGNDENLVLVDFICHSIPSPLAWEEYVKYRACHDNNGEMPIEIDLRSKITGWSRYNYSNLFQYKNGAVTAHVSAESPYMQLFGGEYISRLSCESCSFKGNSRFSDITLGDFWGIWDIHPDIDDNEGVSAVVVNTKKGEEILSSIRNCLFIKEVTAEEICMQNPSFNNSSLAADDREYVLSMISDGKIGQIIEGDLLSPKQNNEKESIISRSFARIKRILGNRNKKQK